MGMIEVENKGSYIIVKSKKGTLIYGEDFISYNPPIEGFYEHGMIVTKTGMVLLDQKPPLIVQENGFDHVLVAINNDFTPVYAINETIDKLFLTEDFKTYTEESEYSPITLSIDQVKKIIKKKKVKIRVDGKTVKIFENYAVARDDETIAVYSLSNGKAKPLFELKIPNERIEKVFEALGDLFITLVNGVSLMVSHGKLRMNYKDVDVKTIETFARLKSLAEITETIEKDPKINTRADVKNIIINLMKHPQTYGPHVAVLTPTKIITRRGMIKMGCKSKKLSEQTRKILEYILYMNDDYIEFRNKGIIFSVEITCKKDTIKFIKRKMKTLKVGKHYYWPDITVQSYDKYIGSAGIKIDDSKTQYIEMTSKSVKISTATILNPKIYQKLTKGEKVSRGDVIPGGESVIELKDNHVKTPNKEFALEINGYEENGYWVTIPFIEGIYNVFIPYATEKDYFNEISVNNIDTAAKVMVYFPFIKGAPVKRIEQVNSFTLLYTLPCGKVKIYYNNDRPYSVTAEINGKKVYIPDDQIEILDAMNSWDKFKKFVMMI